MRLLLAVLATAPAALAQRTWVVDVNNGPGTDFFDIPPAVAAAAPGDLIVVRAGQYNGFSTNKGLRMVGEGAVLLAPSAPGGKALIVDGVPAGQTFSMHGIDGLPRFPFFADVTNNGGTVILSAARVAQTCGCGPLHQNPPGIRIVDSAQVVLDGVVSYGGPAVHSTRSRTLITRCTLGAPTPSDVQGSCLFVDGGEVDVVESTLDGSGGTEVTGVHRPAVELVAGTLRVRGTAAAMIQGGHVVNPTSPGAAIRATGGVVVLDPDVQLNPMVGQNVALQTTGAQLVQRQLAAVAVASFTSGGTAQVDVLAAANAPCAVVVGLPRLGLATVLGTLEVDLAATLPVGSGSAGASGVFAVNLAVPPGLPPGFAFAFQGVTDVGHGPELTSAALIAVR